MAPELDKLFRGEPRWLGADGVSSVQVDSDRTLWLFGDTFFDERTAYNIVHNTVGVQRRGAPLEFYWGRSRTPKAAFPDGEDFFQWPSHGIRVGDDLTVFTMVARGGGANPEFPIDIAGSSAVRVARASELAPEEWTQEVIELAFADGLTVGSGGVFEWGEHVYAYSADQKTLDAFLLRWSRDDFLSGTLGRPEFYSGAGWTARRWAARPILKNAQAEFDTYFDKDLGKFVQVELVSDPASAAGDLFGKTRNVFVGVRFAERPEGPWTQPFELYRPELPDKAFAYAAKAHSHLSGTDLVISFVPNTKDLAGLLTRDSPWYYPSFIKVSRTHLQALAAAGVPQVP